MGPRTIERLERLGLRTIQDLLFHLPLRYEDRTQLRPIAEIRAGETVLTQGRILYCEVAQGQKRSHRVSLTDDFGLIQLRFFHLSRLQQSQMAVGRWLRCYGEVRIGFSGLEIRHPDYEFLEEGPQQAIASALTPVYPTTEGLHQKTLRSLIGQALERLEGVEDPLAQIPLPLDQKLSLHQALRQLHQPPPGIDPTSPQHLEARRRLAFEELLAHHLSLRQFRHRLNTYQAPPLSLPDSIRDALLKSLPFTLTPAQVRVTREILEDLSRSEPMMRLVQGDVGSGKTIVAAQAALAALASGHQVALMAPTDLLAEQHAETFRRWFSPLDIRITFISGRIRGDERRQALEQLRAGTTGLAIGTHALFQDTLAFSRLGLIIIDEQHRFGVQQRLLLRSKGVRGEVVPHQLIMTATPIPRSLAMTGYADLDLSVIDERPPGRTPVKTAVLKDSRKDDVIERVRHWVAEGRQAYWVCTLIEESERLEAEAAEATWALLTQRLPELAIGLVHGRLKSTDKETVMAAFKEGTLDLLVATTVIEVGVDVPNAGLMIIDNAERLGLAQLHQLRGRVGRGPGSSHCILLYKSPLGRTAGERLAILRDTDDGFLIAEKDLQIRGPGELLGTRQTGQLAFKIADLGTDSNLVEGLAQTAEDLFIADPHAAQTLILRWLGTGTTFIEA